MATHRTKLVRPRSALAQLLSVIAHFWVPKTCPSAHFGCVKRHLGCVKQAFTAFCQLEWDPGRSAQGKCVGRRTDNGKYFPCLLVTTSHCPGQYFPFS